MRRNGSPSALRVDTALWYGTILRGGELWSASRGGTAQVEEGNCAPLCVCGRRMFGGSEAPGRNWFP